MQQAHFASGPSSKTVREEAWVHVELLLSHALAVQGAFLYSTSSLRLRIGLTPGVDT